MKIWRCKDSTAVHGVLLSVDSWVIAWGPPERSFTVVDRTLLRAVYFAIRAWWKYGR